jgi:hypothetical protein
MGEVHLRHYAEPGKCAQWYWAGQEGVHFNSQNTVKQVIGSESLVYSDKIIDKFKG